ncbi:hypothetical protein L1889_10355 [Paenalcaligenes niemegkensis]|uniref:hypothetical protein n=1 Tax=Paenalcaligenes niemegkensis TaxID=2895469 RepID=UPI001EE95C80|nr:hypothetical protein [Paenalcaligenes niemegkensis]MCQ9617055.1 hypothetical protein [Paenalcaligenes niemegkensis]
MLKAGETLKLGLTLLEDIELGLGGVLPTTYRYESNRIKAGEPVLAQLATDFGGPITLLADWNIPLDTGEPGRAWLWGYVITAKDPSGKEQSFRPFAGSQADPNVVIPKGWTLVSINNGGFPLDGSYVLPVGVFPTEGIETYNTYTKSLTAGTVLTAELLQEMDSTKVVISAGSPLNPGTQLNRDVRVGAFTQLDPALFQRGFSSYSVAGAQGLSVASNTHLAVEMPVLRPETGAFSLVNKADALSLWTPSLYVENPGSRQLSQRRGASLTLHAGAEPSYAGVFAKPGNVTALIDSNATVSVDPGQSIAIGSIGQLTVAGHLQAKGGNISLTELYANPSAVSGGEPHARSILISGELDVSGGSAVSKQVLPSEVLPYGLVYAAGSIVVGGTIDEEQGDVIAPHLFVEITDSAHLDASGAAAEFAMPGAKLDRHYSQGGAISITSNNGVALDGQLSLHAGGGTAAAGALAVGLGSPAYENVIATVLAPREMMLYQSAEDKPQTVAGAYGVAHLAADDLMATGADTIALFSDGLISFDTQDMLNLQARQSVRLYANSLALTENAASDARINISAPYVRLAGAVGPSPGSYGNSYRKALVDGGRSSRSDDVSAHFMVNANLIDLRDYLTFGTNSLVDRNQIDRRGFELVSLNSDGDIRFLKGLRTPVGSTSTQIQTPKSLTLSAQQIYPGTNAVANVIAGFGWEGREVGSSSYALFDPDSILTIKRPDSVLNSELPAMPLSVFGSLTLGAATVKQQGVIRAPLGTIGLGMASAAGGRTRQLNLHPGSLTSVSAQGLIMPYGGTADGIAYNYNGAPVFLQGAANSLNSGVLLTSGLIDVQQGAVLDLSGGGELTGAGFVSGRGGSTDARFHPLMQIGADGTLITPLAGLDSNPVYAIVPGISAYAPLDGEAGASAPLVGQTITVPDGVPGLKAGTYSLLPSTYALLPGAFRVELNGNNAYPQGASPMAMHNGSWIAGASLGIAHTPVSDALPRSVILTSADVLRSYSQYNETSYAEFVLADAARQGIGRGALPADGKSLHLIFNPQAADVATQQAFKYAGTALFNADQGGYGGALLIRQTSDTRSEQRTVEILPGTQMETGHDFNGLSLHAADLNAVKAHGLIIGGALRNDYGQGGTTSRLALRPAGVALVIL